MHELSAVDSEVTFRKVMGSAETLPTRPSVDPNEITRPMDEIWSESASTQLTTVSPSVIASTRTTPRPLQLYNTVIQWLVHWPLMSGLLHLVQRVETCAGWAPPSPLLTVPNVTAHPSTSYYLMWHYNCLWALKGLNLSLMSDRDVAFSITKAF